MTNKTFTVVLLATASICVSGWGDVFECKYIAGWMARGRVYEGACSRFVKVFTNCDNSLQGY
jgi:hypothetical protein